jgi:hypothetical protein
MNNQQGVLVYARNNSQIDYVKQAIFLAKRVHKYLDLPVSVVTDSIDYINKSYPQDKNLFDHIIPMRFDGAYDDKSVLSPGENHSIRHFYDGSLVYKRLEWKNNARSTAFHASPYEETLLLDSDIVICNSFWTECFKQKKDFLAYRDCVDLLDINRGDDFRRISDTSVDFYWASAVFFRKTSENEIFFGLVKHIQDNWRHYCRIFQINTSYFRNDYAFSIAIHIMNGYQIGDFANPLPGILYYATDKSILWEIESNRLLFLLEKPKYVGEYTPLRTESSTVHVLNKFSLNRCIDAR